METKFCVYIHRRPDGTPFYIGKGLLTRAYDFAPSRRTLWHKNIVNKYGRNNIIVQVIPCMYEKEAFELEKVHIKIAKAEGHNLANLTAGGEGASGRKSNEKQLAALAKGRRVGKRGVKGPRPQLDRWKQTEEGKLHLKRLGEAGKARLHAERKVVCQCCKTEFVTRSAKAKFCCRNCWQRTERAKAK